MIALESSGTLPEGVPNTSNKDYEVSVLAKHAGNTLINSLLKRSWESQTIRTINVSAVINPYSV